VIDALRGVGAALETVSTLLLMCDPRDIGQTLGDGGDSEHAGGDARPAGRDPFRGRTGNFDPTVFLFDAHPGGVGLAPRIFERAADLFQRARALIEHCPCPEGCPACVGPTSEEGSRKSLALRLMRELVDRPSPVRPERPPQPRDSSPPEPPGRSLRLVART
jgi:DEAD/DEAH box helicase domain-containing protein